MIQPVKFKRTLKVIIVLLHRIANPSLAEMKKFQLSRLSDELPLRFEQGNLCSLIRQNNSGQTKPICFKNLAEISYVS